MVFNGRRIMTAAAPITQPVKRKYGKRRRERYEQDWEAIARAQANELADFILLLRDLSHLIPEELSFQQAKGRHRIPLSDVAFSMIYKVYFGFPGRLMGSRKYEKSPLMQLYAGGVISRPMHWNSIGHHMRDVRMSEVLEYLIETSALALISVETGELTHRVLPMVAAEGGDFSADATIIDGAVRLKKGAKGYRGHDEYDISAFRGIARFQKRHGKLTLISAHLSGGRFPWLTSFHTLIPAALQQMSAILGSKYIIGRVEN
jgi:hypothetical protein